MPSRSRTMMLSSRGLSACAFRFPALISTGSTGAGRDPTEAGPRRGWVARVACCG